MYPALLSINDFIDRTVMPKPDIRRARGAQWKKNNADALATSTLAPLVFARREGSDAIALELDFVPQASLIADPVNFATLTVSKITPGNPAVVIGSVDTRALSWVAYVPVPIVVNAAPANAIASGDVLTFGIAKSGAGVIVPAGELFVVWSPSFIDTAIADVSSEIYARLTKRYEPPTDANPWPAPVMGLLKRWCCDLVTPRVYADRGWAPVSEQDKASILDTAELTEKKLIEAADGQNGLIELELGEDGKESVTRDSPMAYHEASPYTAKKKQRRDGRREDRSFNGNGED